MTRINDVFSTMADPIGGEPMLALDLSAPRANWIPFNDRDWGEVGDSIKSQVMRACGDGGPWPLVFLGPAGCGKTCLSLLMLDAVRVPRAYHEAVALAADVAEAMMGGLRDPDGHAVRPDGIWGRWTRAPLAVLDELGARERVSDHHYGVVKLAIDNREGKPLIVCSNLAIRDLARVYDDRIASRLASGTVIEFDGKDRRL